MNRWLDDKQESKRSTLGASNDPLQSDCRTLDFRVCHDRKSRLSPSFFSPDFVRLPGQVALVHGSSPVNRSVFRTALRFLQMVHAVWRSTTRNDASKFRVWVLSIWRRSGDRAVFTREEFGWIVRGCKRFTMSSIVEFRTVLGNCGISRYWDDFLAFERDPSELIISFLRSIDRFV